MRQIELSKVNKDVKVVDGKLFFGDKEVQDCQFIKEQSIAALYIIRVKDGRHKTKEETELFASFVGGLDLIDGRFWLGAKNINMWKDQKQKSIPSAYYDNWESVEYVLDNLVSDTAGKEWIICEEEDFENDHTMEDWAMEDYPEDDPWDEIEPTIDFLDDLGQAKID